MHRKHILPTLLCSALLWSLAPGAQAETTGGAAKNAPCVTANPPCATAPKDAATTSVVETPAMKEAMRAYDAGSYEEAFIYTEPMARMNQADAQYLLGLMYELGHGVAKDTKKAVELFTASASQGYAAAEAKLGELHLTDHDKDYGKARSWFEKAADHGYALAYSALGDLYYNGYGVAENKDTALEYYKKAATAGDAEACFRLGTAYETGTNVTADRKQALFWYKKGAALGNKACEAKVQKLQ
ncbi:MAG: tetratricopeptide repeat protein [Bilophila sp.]